MTKAAPGPDAGITGHALRELREYRYWHEQRDRIVANALKLGISAARITAESGVHGSVIRKIREAGRGQP